MTTATFLHDLVFDQAERRDAAMALKAGRITRTYGELAAEVGRAAAGLRAFGLVRDMRVAVYLDKRIETVAAIFATAAAGGVFVPCNPVLKGYQVGHILRDSGAGILVTSRARLEALRDELPESAVRAVISVDDLPEELPAGIAGATWPTLLQAGGDPGRATARHGRVESDMAAILYTSGSTGKPKGVVLSHRNLVVGGRSVAQYLENGPHDRLLALLPLSFDAGFSQLTTGFTAGATVVLHNYLLPRDVPRVCAREGITGITAVPPLWMQLLETTWPAEAAEAPRYFANTGGRMPRDVLARLRRLFVNARPYLMYGLTEAFRSTYLDPAEVDRRPDSIGKAIPNAEILVARADGTLCGAGEEGELVHRGPLVALGYWRDPARTAERFRPAPGRPEGCPLPEMAVWSGDLVRSDAEGFLYFVGRNDEMIKTSGYRVSPTEVEEVVFESGLVAEAAAFGVPHRTLGQAIGVAVVPANGATLSQDALLAHCLERLPRFMVPGFIEPRRSLPRSPNGKIDRKALAAACETRFMETES